MARLQGEDMLSSLAIRGCWQGLDLCRLPGSWRSRLHLGMG